MSNLRSILGASAVTLGLAAAAQAQSSLADGLVGWWRFDEGAGTVASDSSANGNAGNFVVVNASQAVYGAGTQFYSLSPSWASGVLGGALSLLNNPIYPGPLTVVLDPYYGITCTWYQTVNIGVSTARVVNNCGRVTVACWVHPASFAGATSQYYAWKTSTSMNVIGFADYGSAIYGSAPYPLPPSGYVDKVLYLDAGGNPRFNILVSGTPYVTPTPTATVPLNTWTHLCATYDGDTATVWMNGVPVSSTNGLGGLSCTAFSHPNIWIGMGLNNFDYATFNGLLDNARVYDRALSSNEVAQVYAYDSTGSVLPWPATASAVVESGFVVGVNITDRGYGYTNTPLVWVEGGGGTGARATAVVRNGFVVGITITDAGLGYTTTPLIVIQPPFVANPVLNIAPMSLLTFSNLSAGGVYQLQQSRAWYWTNLPVSFTATSSIHTQMVSGVAGSGDYRLALTPVPEQAFAVARVLNGFVVGVTVTGGGSGYAEPPPVRILGGGGTNATAVSQIFGGVVTNVMITSAGRGYTNTPTVEIAQPPAAAVSPTVQFVARVDSAGLAPYENYQIQFTPAVDATWRNWDGGSFSPRNVTNSQYLFPTNDAGFFRLQYLP